MRATRGLLVLGSIVMLSTAVLIPAGIPTAVAAADTAPAVAPHASHPTKDTAPRRVYPTVDAAQARRVAQGSAGSASPFASSGAQPQLTYHGGVHGIGVTTGAPKVYLVFWGSQWGSANPPGSTNFSNDNVGVANRLVALMNGLGTNNELWSGVVTQYCEGVPSGTELCPASAPHVGYPTGGALAGVWADTAAPTPSQSTGNDLGTEAVKAAGHFGNTTPESNRNVQYVIVSPKGTHPDGFNTNTGFCAWHGYNGNGWVNAPSAYGDVAFTNLPYIPDMGKSCGANFVNAGAGGLLDGVTMVEGHEFSETITDQNPGGGWWDSDGEENADKCAWLHVGQVGAAQNVSFATGTFAMQSTWSNDGQLCSNSHAIWGVAGLPDSYAIDATPRSGFAMPGGTVSTTVQGTTVTGNPQNVTLSATGVPPDATLEFSSSTMSTDDNVTMSIATAAATPLGQYIVTVTAAGAQTHTATYSLTVDDTIPTLQNGVAVTSLSGGLYSQRFFQIDVPTGMSIADFSIGGGTGDADLYIQRDTLPDDTNRFCASRGSNTNDSCQVYSHSEGHWYVGVFGASAYSQLSVQVSFAVASSVLRKHVYADLSGAAGSHHDFWFNVPANRHHLTISISRTKGDADLRMRLFGLPTPFATVCTKIKRGQHGETCSVRNPYSGTWWIDISGFTDYTRLSFVAKY